MEWIVLLILIVILFLSTLWLVSAVVPARTEVAEMPKKWEQLLERKVQWYRQLESIEDKRRFRECIMNFLDNVNLSPIETDITTLDKLYIASSAIIPIFRFKKWSDYPNLDEILIYPDRFTADNYATKGEDRHTLGMVGWQVMESKMIISRKAMRSAFEKESGKSHVGIHEFVHLLDKMDGATDGVPEYLLDREYTVPWLSLIHTEINKIVDGYSDINPYGAKNEAEFFAVVAEYFFTDPEELREKHPKIYEFMEEIFDN